MTVKRLKHNLLLLFLATNSKAFAVKGTTLDSFSPSLINMSLRQYQQNKLDCNQVSSNVVEPSKLYSPDFYDKNELKEVFEVYSVVREKIENPMEAKKVNLLKNMEMSVAPRFKSSLTGATIIATYTNFIFSLELKAIFL